MPTLFSWQEVFRMTAESWEQQMAARQNWINRQLTFNLTLNYIFNPNHSIGGSYRFVRVPKSASDLDLETNILQDNTPFEQSISDVLMNAPSSRHEANAYYNGKLGDWEIDFNGTFLKNKAVSSLRTNENIETYLEGKEQNEVHTHTDTRNTFYASKLVVSYPLFVGNLAFGGEFTHTRRTSRYQNQEGIVNDDNSKMKELMAAAFVEYGHKFGFVDFLIGLRLENVDFDYYQDGIYQD